MREVVASLLTPIVVSNKRAKIVRGLVQDRQSTAGASSRSTVRLCWHHTSRLEPFYAVSFVACVS